MIPKSLPGDTVECARSTLGIVDFLSVQGTSHALPVTYSDNHSNAETFRKPALCDASNENVKLLGKDLELLEHLKPCSCPLDVAVVDDNNIIITLPGTKQLQYMQVVPHLKAGRTFQLDKVCRGIEVFGDEIYSAQCDDSGQREVQVLDLNGSRKRKLQTDAKFYCPWYITVSTSGKKIFVSGGSDRNGTVTCMTTDGNLVYQYGDEELRIPNGMYVDAEDNISVCDINSNTVQMITANGKKHGTLLPSNDEIIRPSSIAYRETDDTLLVGCMNKTMFLFINLYPLDTQRGINI